MIAVALRRLGDTEVDRIAAPIRRAGLDVFRASARAGRPRRLPRRYALLDLRLAGRGERGVVVVQVPPGLGCRRRLFTPPGHALPPFPRDGLSARRVWNVLLSRRGDRGSRRGQRHVVRVPHHGRRLTAVNAGHACAAPTRHSIAPVWFRIICAARRAFPSAPRARRPSGARARSCRVPGGRRGRRTRSRGRRGRRQRPLRYDATSSGWTRQRRSVYRQTTVQEPWGDTIGRYGRLPIAA